MDCIACGKDAQIVLRTLQLRTMHVRGLTGEDKYQVPDDAVGEYGVCRECAEKWLREGGTAGGRAVRKYILFGILFCAGIVLSVVFRGSGHVLMMPAAAAVFAGAAGLVSAFRGSAEEKKRIGAMPLEEALREAAFQVFLEKAPKEMEEGQWKLTYIPVNEKTLSTKPGDLTVIYDIQPAVAKEVMLKIGHPQA